MGKLQKVEKCIARKKASELISLAEDKDAEVRAAAIRGLGQVGGEEAYNGLIGLLKSRDDDMLIAAAEALGNMGNSHADAHLLHLLQVTENDGVRQAAKDALARLPRSRE